MPPCAAALILCLFAAAPPASAQHEDLNIYSTASGAGELVADFDFAARVAVTDRLGFCPGGICFYSSVNPGYMTPAASRPAAGLFALRDGTAVSFAVVAFGTGVSIKWGAAVLDIPGESARIGTASDLHVHPEYQLQAPQGVVDEFGLSFRLTTDSPFYEDSQVYTFTLTNGDVPVDTPTNSPTNTATLVPPTATPPPTATQPPTATAVPSDSPTATITATATHTVPPNATCDGDCDGNGAVSIGELVRGVGIALGRMALDTCASFDIDGNRSLSIGELISAVADALNGC